MNRREFIKQSAGIAGAAAVWRANIGMADPVDTSHAAAGLCALGNSGLQCTRLGVGTGTRAWNKDSAQIRAGRDVFLNTLKRAYGLGIRYYDLADMYGSHAYLRDAVTEAGINREELFILTKLTSKTGEEVRDDLKRALEETGVQYFDAVLLHCLTSGEWPESMAVCMDALEEARAEGLIKAKGVSCHHIHALQSAATNDWVDIILARINPFGTQMDGTPDEIQDVLRLAKGNGKGVVGMKILGEGKHAADKKKCIEFAMSLDCIDAFTIGFLNADELNEIVALMDACAPTG